MIGFFRERMEAKRKKDEVQLANALKICRVNRWSKCNGHQSILVKRASDSSFTVIQDGYHVKKIHCIHGTHIREIPKNKPKQMNEFSRYSEWGRVLEFNFLYHEANELDPWRSSDLYRKNAKICIEYMRQLERVHFNEHGTKEAFDYLKRDVETWMIPIHNRLCEDNAKITKTP